MRLQAARAPHCTKWTSSLARPLGTLRTSHGAASRPVTLARTSRGAACITGASRTDTLRRLLKDGPGILQGPCCHDALSAKLIEDAGFPFAFMSGFCTAGARLGAPDTGLISYGEMVDQGRCIHEATRRLPVIGDGDTGYGNALNVKRTVRGYAAAGFAGILIEDQVAPKSCGHVKGKRVVDRAEAVARIRAAADARDEGADILIVARSDARQAVSLEEALWRAAAFADAGADVVFIDALESSSEMSALCGLGGAVGRLPKMASMLEGGGKTPVLSPEVLEALGFKLVAYPLSLLGVSIRAMQKALQGLKAGRVPPADALGSFADIQAAVGFPEYYREEMRYAVPTDSSSASTPSSAAPRAAPAAPVSAPLVDPLPVAAPPPRPAPPPPATAAKPMPPPSQPPPPPATTPGRRSWSRSAGVPFGSVAQSVDDGAAGAGSSGTASSSGSSSTASSTAGSSSSSSSSSSPTPSAVASGPAGHAEASAAGAAPVVEADAVIVPGAPSAPNATPASSMPVLVPREKPEEDSYGKRGPTLRVRITDSQSAMVKLETCIPAGFMSGVAAVVPQLSGMDLQALLDKAMGGRGAGAASGPITLVNFDSGVDIVQVFLEL